MNNSLKLLRRVLLLCLTIASIRGFSFGADIAPGKKCDIWFGCDCAFDGKKVECSNGNFCYLLKVETVGKVKKDEDECELSCLKKNWNTEYVSCSQKNLKEKTKKIL